MWLETTIERCAQCSARRFQVRTRRSQNCVNVSDNHAPADSCREAEVCRETTRNSAAVEAGSVDASEATAAQASQRTQGTQAYEAQRPPVFDRLGPAPSGSSVGSSWTPTWASKSVAWNPCFFAAARACRGMKFLDEDGRPVRDCPRLLEETCPRPYDRQTCQAVWTHDADFRDRLDNYVKVVKRNNYSLTSLTEC